jgi:hypothetical protein
MSGQDKRLEPAMEEIISPVDPDQNLQALSESRRLAVTNKEFLIGKPGEIVFTRPERNIQTPFYWIHSR